jgi:hypothetical protein
MWVVRTVVSMVLWSKTPSTLGWAFGRKLVDVSLWVVFRVCFIELASTVGVNVEIY